MIPFLPLTGRNERSVFGGWREDLVGDVLHALAHQGERGVHRGKAGGAEVDEGAAAIAAIVLALYQAARLEDAQPAQAVVGGTWAPMQALVVGTRRFSRPAT